MEVKYWYLDTGPGAPVSMCWTVGGSQLLFVSYLFVILFRDTHYSDLHYCANDRTLPRTTSPSGLVGAPQAV